MIVITSCIIILITIMIIMLVLILLGSPSPGFPKICVRFVVARSEKPASKRGQDKRFFCRSAAIYHDYDIIMALLWDFMALL